jgi:hypothetical protein
MHENSPVALPELCAVLGVAEDNVRELVETQPFKMGNGDTLRLRQALGLAVLTQFAMSGALPPDTASYIAVEAANGAVLGRGCSMLVAWQQGKPRTGWFDGPATAPPIAPQEGFGSPLRLPLLIVPADAMFADLAAAIAAFRARRSGVTAH